MTDRTDRNRLGGEASPYLQAHADNPVHWQPWDDDALAVAREREVPLFVSIGYSACHWCHVMEEESFADEDVAAVLNENFVPIKVDREERPDVDSLYMTVCQLVTGGGGWPLNAWCTPEGKPFYVGTYFPPESRHNRPGFRELCEQIAESWADPDQRDEMANRADQWTRAARDQLEDVPDQPGEPPEADVVEQAAAAAIRSFDEGHGGFGSSGPKFPQPGRIELLLSAFARTGRDAALTAATETLDAMARGGMYDHVGGGFHRYATDRDWTVPHFEKMLYDNASLPSVYLDAYRVTGDPRHARIAQETFAFVERELTHPDGGFFSTLDARSIPPASRRDDGGDADTRDSNEAPDDRDSNETLEPEEGAFYVWTPDEVRAVLSEPDASIVCDRYGIDVAGNFEGGTTVLTIAMPIEDLQAEYELDRAEIRERLMDARAALFEARNERPRPARDEKVLAAWNGLMISAFAKAGTVLGPEFADIGADALAFVRDRLWDGTVLRRRWLDGDVTGPGYLDDYAFLARGAFDLYQATGDHTHLGFALDLAEDIVADFTDEDAGTIYFTRTGSDDLPVRSQEVTDGSTPSSLGVAVGLLLDLDGFAPDRDFRGLAETVLETHSDRIHGSPLEHVSLARAAEKAHLGPTELTIAANSIPDEWRAVLAGHYLPNGIVAPRPPTEAGLDSWLDELGLSEAPPIWANREAVDDEPTVYACRDFTCSPPQTDLRTALDWLSS